MVTKVAQKANVKKRCKMCRKTRAASSFNLAVDKVSLADICKTCCNDNVRKRKAKLAEHGIREAMSLNRAAEILGVAAAKVEALLAENGIPLVDIGLGDRRHMRAEASLVERLAAERIAALQPVREPVLAVEEPVEALDASASPLAVTVLEMMDVQGKLAVLDHVLATHDLSAVPAPLLEASRSEIERLKARGRDLLSQLGIEGG